ncbi:MAG: ABC transporter ATP-binding protein [Oligoflexia bacterium]|nr:ABC transporter ATP-binding protein [Oligoflexia bacterium]
MTALLRVNGMSLSLSAVRLLSEISFQVAAGEVIAILGPNGAGKSSLIKCLNRIFPEAQGQILLEGRPLAAFTQRQIAARIGYAPQRFAPIFSYSVRQFVELGTFSGAELAEGQRRTGVDQAIEICGIQHLGQRDMASLSGGELQLVLLAGALVGNPRLLLLDEPTTFLDPAFQLRVLSILKTLRDRTEGQTAVIMATHDINLALELSSRVIGLSQGRVSFDCTPREILNGDLLTSLYQSKFSRVSVPGRECGFIVPVA